MRYSLADISTFLTSYYQQGGLSEEDAHLMAQGIVHAEGRGITSHGLARARVYCERIALGQLNNESAITTVKEGVASLVLDANNAPGLIVGQKAMDLTVAKAKKNGVCVTTVCNTSHYGAGSYHVLKASDAKCIGFSICNADASVVPYGGQRAMLGTNPITIAMPAGSFDSVCLDMATSVVSRGKALYYERVGKPLPKGWIVDSEGNDSTDPADIFSGALLGFGLYKGYGLGLIIDLLTSALAGGKTDRELGSFHSSPLSDEGSYTNIGIVMAAIDIEAFTSIEGFVEKVESICREFKESPTRSGVEEVLLPGEIEARAYAKHLIQGVEVSPVIIEEFTEIAAKYGLESPF